MDQTEDTKVKVTEATTDTDVEILLSWQGYPARDQAQRCRQETQLYN